MGHKRVYTRLRRAMAKSGMLAAMRATCRKPPSRAVRDEQLFVELFERCVLPAKLELQVELAVVVGID